MEGSTATTGTRHAPHPDADKKIAQSAPESPVTTRPTHLQRTAGNTAVLRTPGKRTAVDEVLRSPPEPPDPALRGEMEQRFDSTEATANPKSILHGHKGDEVGSGGLSKNERLVEPGEMGKNGDWRTFLNETKAQCDAAPAETENGSQERKALYQSLIGPRTQPKP